MITQSELKEVLHYDADTGIFTFIKGRTSGRVAGHKHISNSKQYIRITINYVRYFAHNLAFIYMTGDLPMEFADHINGNGLDNKWSNLRQVSSLENQKNQRLFSANKTGFCGVQKIKDRDKYKVSIVVNYKNIYLGSFDNIDDAISARKEANIKYGFHENHGSERPL